MLPFSPLPSSELLSALNWRYATKSFDAEAPIPVETWAALEKTLVLSASSWGLQPWKFLVIQSPELRQQLLPFAWGQKQVVEASHLVVFAVVKAVDEAYVDKFLTYQAEVRGVGVETLAGYRKMILSHVKSFNADQLEDWSARQVYIALGSFMTAAAVLGVDTSPLEGFMPAKFDEVLDLPSKGLASCVLCAAGYRSQSDKYASQAKVRYSAADIIDHR